MDFSFLPILPAYFLVPFPPSNVFHASFIVSVVNLLENLRIVYSTILSVYSLSDKPIESHIQEACMHEEC